MKSRMRNKNVTLYLKLFGMYMDLKSVYDYEIMNIACSSEGVSFLFMEYGPGGPGGAVEPHMLFFSIEYWPEKKEGNVFIMNSDGNDCLKMTTELELDYEEEVEAFRKKVSQMICDFQ